MQSDGTEIKQSYASLYEEAEQILAGLRRQGLQPGDIVMLQVEENQDYLPTFWACVLGGLVAAPVSIAPSYTQPTITITKLQKAWELCDHPLIVASASLAPALRVLAPTLGMNDLRLETVETLRALPSEAHERSLHDCQPDDVFLLLFTSGSTGTPKGVMLTHRNVLSLAMGYTQLEGLTPQEITFNWMPLDHIGGLVTFHLRDIYLGCQQIHARPSTVLQDPLMWLDCLDRYHATCTWAPNFAFSLINERAAIIAQRQWDLSSLHYILDAGEAIVPKTARRFLELLAPHGLASNAIHPSWGMSETSSGVTFSSRFSLETTTDEDRFVDVGALIPEVWVRVVDEYYQLVAEGKSGRIQVKGPTVTPGYFHHPEFNQEAFTADGWFETGDVGMLREGRLTITGRSKHIIIINGLNYYSHEIEAVVEEIAGVAVTYTGACAVRDAENNTDTLAIFYHSLFTDVPQILKQREEIFLRVVSAVGINPTYLIPLEKEAIPKTETGKVQRTKLKQQFEEGMFDPVLKRLHLVPARPLMQLTAYLKLKPVEDASYVLAAARKAHISDRFGQSVPCTLVQVEAFPLTPTGEIDREALRRQGQLVSANNRTMSDILSTAEQQLIYLWQEIFKQTEIHKQDHFFLLGGHSLTLMQLLARIQETFQVKLTIQDIFDCPTVAALAQRIETGLRGEHAGQHPPLLPLLQSVEYKRNVQEQPLTNGHVRHLPLSFAQQQQWVLNQLDPYSPRYNVPGVIHLQGELDIAALERSLQEVVRRHDALRTTFVSVDKEPIQVIAPSLTVPIPISDLQHLPINERLAEARRLATTEGRSPFNLMQGPLIRTLLFVLGPDEYIFTLSMHHIVSDGWSMGIFLQELFASYLAFASGTLPQLPDLPIQYADYAFWQRQWMQDDVLQPLLTYWKQKLEGAPPAIVLPTDRSRPTVSGSQGASVSLLLSQPLSEALQMLSRQREATLFMTMLTALNILLFQWTGQPDMVVGTVLANRTEKETEKLIGCFMNFLALRSQISEQMTGLELLAEVKGTVIEAHIHQDYPFEKLVAAINPVRKSNQYPLYNIAFLLQNFPFSPHVVQNIFSPSMGNKTLQFSLLPLEMQVALLDLRLIAEETPKGIHLECEYDTDLFDAETIEQFLASYTHIIETFVQTPTAPISSFNISPQLEAQAGVAKAREYKETIAITATFTSEPLEESLAFWIQELAWPLTVAFAPYNQIFQQLLDPGSLLAQNQQGINVVLLRLEDWLRFDTTLGTAAQAEEKIERNADELVQALRTATRHITTPYLIYVCPASPMIEADPVRRAFFAQMEDQLATDLAELHNVFLVNSAELKTVYPVETSYDPYADEMGHIPFSTDFFAALGTHIVRKISALRRRPMKVIALDCDQTLWQGICGEDGAQGVIIDPPRKALQEFLVAQQEAGVLLCLCSKNNEPDVFEVFACHPEMPLKREHLVVWRINWEPKSQNLRALAEELQLSLDSFIFIDDNPLECAEVQALCPEVLTLPVPPESDRLPHLLQHFWAFDHVRITAEDRKRTELYQQQLQRQAFQQTSATLEGFLAALQLQVHIAPLEEAQLDRVAQLTQRTNQFNCSTIRRTESELQRFCLEAKAGCLVINVSDRFGDYGLVGAILFTENQEDLEVDTFLLSCRVLGRGVEYQMLARLGKIAYEHQRDRVRVLLVPTPRNKPACEFLESIGGAFKKPLGEGWVFEFPVEVLMELTYSPSVVKQLDFDAGSGNEFTTQGKTLDLTVRYQINGERLLRIATELSTSEQVVNAIAVQHRRLSSRQGVGAVPRTETERRLVEIWREVFKVEQIGIHDNFFALGGDSILSIQIVARANQASIPIYPRHIFEYQTIAELAQEVQQEIPTSMIAHGQSGNSTPTLSRPTTDDQTRRKPSSLFCATTTVGSQSVRSLQPQI